MANFYMAKINLMVAILALLILPDRLHAFVRSEIAWLPKIDFISSHATLALHPYQRSTILPNYALYQHNWLDLTSYGKLLLREQGLDHLVEIVAQHRSAKRVDYRYRLQGHDICDLHAALTHLRHGGIYQRGRYPTTIWAGHALVWPAVAAATEVVTELFALRPHRIGATRRCLLATAQGYVPVYDVFVMVAGLPYQVRTDGYEVFAVQRQYYDVQGEFHVYRENMVRNERKEKFLIEVQGDGRLVNKYFKAMARDADGNRTQLQQDNNIFDYDDSDTRMAQVSAFAHANLMLQWFKQMGFDWYGDSQIEVTVHANYDPVLGRIEPNNAFYSPSLPSPDASTPRIMIGDGDNIKLQNLALDGDVVAHELGHHVIYQYLTTTSGQSGAIHEGLADYFVFARTGNACLAESTCPAESDACQLQGKCLRYADHSYSWYDLEGLGVHIEGQVLSALLWDLRQEHNLAAATVNKIAFDAVQHFTAQSGLRDFIDALLMADLELNSGGNCVAIINAALGRGLQKFIADDIDCNGVQPQIIKVDKASDTSKNSATKASLREQGCGTIFTSSATSGYALILLCLPLLLCFLRNCYALHRHPHPSHPRAFRR